MGLFGPRCLVKGVLGWWLICDFVIGPLRHGTRVPAATSPAPSRGCS